MLFAEAGDGDVVRGDFMAVGAFEAPPVSAVQADEAGAWNPMIIELALAVGARQPRNGVRPVPWQKQKDYYENRRYNHDVD